MGNHCCKEDPEVIARQLVIDNAVENSRNELASLGLTADQILDRLTSLIYLKDHNVDHEYTVNFQSHSGLDRCIICDSHKSINYYSICKDGLTLKFDLMSLHYIRHHNYFNLRFSENKEADIQAVACFLKLKPGKSYNIKKNKYREWKSFYDRDDGINIGIYKMSDIDLSIELRITQLDLKEQKRYLMTKYLPHYRGDSDDYLLAGLRNCDAKILIEDPIFYIRVKPTPRDAVVPYGKPFLGYYMKQFDSSCYRKHEFWPDYLIASERTN